jgi:hypothetical protein
MVLLCTSRGLRAPLPTTGHPFSHRHPGPALSGGGETTILSDNVFNVWLMGIYYKLAWNGASAWTISDNEVTACTPPVPMVDPVYWIGMSIERSRIQGMVALF